MSKLHIRNAYLNRPHKREGQVSQIPFKKIRTLANRRAGCSNWQPQPEELDINDVRTALKNINEETFIHIWKEPIPNREFF